MSDDTIILNERAANTQSEHAVMLHWPDEFVRQEMCSRIPTTLQHSTANTVDEMCIRMRKKGKI